MSSKVAVVIPIYKDGLNVFEKISLVQVQKVLGHYPVIFIAPEGKNFAYIHEDSQVIYFAGENFNNVFNYNQLMLKKDFYKKFFDYDYILLYQLDAFVFSDKLQYFCLLGYDYIGAAWPYMWGILVRKIVDDKKIVLRAGNGGFSLRNVKSFYDVLNKHEDLIKSWRGNEDSFFAYCGVRNDIDFKNAPVNIAYKFSAEFLPERIQQKNGSELPFGCHAFYRYSADFYIKTFEQLGYDLTPLSDKMQSQDIDNLKRWFEYISYNRFCQSVNKGRSISQIANRDFYFSIYVLKNKISNAILKKIIAEQKINFNKIFEYDLNDIGKLVLDLKKVKKNVLVLTESIDVDRTIISELKKINAKVKGKVAFFHNLLLKYHEKLLHNLGK